VRTVRGAVMQVDWDKCGEVRVGERERDVALTEPGVGQCFCLFIFY
jgi:hypothetical protein